METITSANAIGIAKVCIATDIVWFINNKPAIVTACDPDLGRIKINFFKESKEYSLLSDLYAHTPLLTNKSILSDYIKKNNEHSPNWDKLSVGYCWVGLDFFDYNDVKVNSNAITENYNVVKE